MKTIACALFLTILLGACAYPSTTIRQGAATELYVPHAPADAVLLVDGKSAGPAAYYDGKKRSYPVEPGTHIVLITGSGGTLLQKSIYVGAGSKLALEVAQ